LVNKRLSKVVQVLASSCLRTVRRDTHTRFTRSIFWMRCWLPHHRRIVAMTRDVCQSD